MWPLVVNDSERQRRLAATWRSAVGNRRHLVDQMSWPNGVSFFFEGEGGIRRQGCPTLTSHVPLTDPSIAVPVASK